MLELPLTPQPLEKSTMADAPIQHGKLLFSFESYETWLNTNKSIYKALGLKPAYTVAIDSQGRMCAWREHFSTARDEGTFPIRVYLLRVDMNEDIKPG